MANVSSSLDTFTLSSDLWLLIFKPAVLSLMYFSFSHSSERFCNPSKLSAYTVSSGKDCEEDNVMNQLLFSCFAGFIQCCLFYRHSIMDVNSTRSEEESAHVENEGCRREGQLWSVLASKVFEGHNKIAEITAASLWHRRVITAVITAYAYVITA